MSTVTIELDCAAPQPAGLDLYTGKNPILVTDEIVTAVLSPRYCDFISGANERGHHREFGNVSDEFGVSLHA
jgi:hypothetical protein